MCNLQSSFLVFYWENGQKSTPECGVLTALKSLLLLFLSLPLLLLFLAFFFFSREMTNSFPINCRIKG